MTRQVLKFIIFGALVILLAEGCVMLVDPFYRFDVMSIPTVNEQRNQFAFAGRMSKAENICRVQPEQIVMGGSKVEIAIDPRSPLWGDQPVYNLGLAGMPLSELSQTFQFVARNAPLKRAVIGLDFLMFNQLREDVVYHTEVVDFDADRISGTCAHALAHDWNSILGPKALAYSARTILTQHEIGREANTSLLASLWNRYSDSYWAQTLKGADDNAAYWALIFDDLGYRANFPIAYNATINGFGGHGQEEYYVEKIWRPGPRHAYEFGNTLAEFRHLVRWARSKGIDVRFFTEPLHARMLLAIYDAGLGEKFEEWKRGLVAVLAEEADYIYACDGKTQTCESSQRSFPLYDFEAFSSITEEAVTEGKPTKWWWEPAHYKKEAGDLLLSRVLDYGSESVPTDFGVQLTPDTVETYLGVQRAASRAYVRAHPEVAAGVARAVDASIAKTPTQVSQ